MTPTENYLSRYEWGWSMMVTVALKILHFIFEKPKIIKIRLIKNEGQLNILDNIFPDAVGSFN